jgi:hypothetical protein
LKERDDDDSPAVQAERKSLEKREKEVNGPRASSKVMYRVAEIRSEEDTSIKNPWR